MFMHSTAMMFIAVILLSRIVYGNEIVRVTDTCASEAKFQGTDVYFPSRHFRFVEDGSLIVEDVVSGTVVTLPEKTHSLECINQQIVLDGSFKIYEDEIVGGVFDCQKTVLDRGVHLVTKDDIGYFWGLQFRYGEYVTARPTYYCQKGLVYMSNGRLIPFIKDVTRLCPSNRLYLTDSDGSCVDSILSYKYTLNNLTVFVNEEKIQTTGRSLRLVNIGNKYVLRDSGTLNVPVKYFWRSALRQSYDVVWQNSQFLLTHNSSILGSLPNEYPHIDANGAVLYNGTSTSFDRLRVSKISENSGSCYILLTDSLRFVFIFPTSCNTKIKNVGLSTKKCSSSFDHLQISSTVGRVFLIQTKPIGFFPFTLCAHNNRTTVIRNYETRKDYNLKQGSSMFFEEPYLFSPFDPSLVVEDYVKTGPFEGNLTVRNCDVVSEDKVVARLNTNFTATYNGNYWLFSLRNTDKIVEIKKVNQVRTDCTKLYIDGDGLDGGNIVYQVNLTDVRLFSPLDCNSLQ